MNDSTHIRVGEGNADRLHELKQRGDSYDDVIGRLLDYYEQEQEAQTAD